MDSEQQQQGAMEYAVVDTSKKKQKRNEQQNVSNLLRMSNVLFQETRHMPDTGKHAPGFFKLFCFICQYVCVCVPVLITSGMA